MPEKKRDEKLITRLTPQEEREFQTWAQANGVKNIDHPLEHYDWRLYWKQQGRQGHSTKMYADGPHSSDIGKLPSHETFSVESAFSKGPWHGGRWIGEDYAPWGADFLMNSRGQSKINDNDMARMALLELMKR